MNPSRPTLLFLLLSLQLSAPLTTRPALAFAPPQTRESGITLRGHSSYVTSLAFSPDGRWLASGGTNEDGTVRLWDVRSGAMKWQQQPHKGATTGIVFSHDGRLVAGSGFDTVKIWNAADGTLVRTIPGITKYSYALAFSPDGVALAGANGVGDIFVWDVRTGRQRWTQKFMTGEGFVSGLAFSPDGQSLASCGGWRTPVKVWDSRTGRLRRAITHNSNSIGVLAFSPDGRLLLGGGEHNHESGVVLLWDAGSGSEVARLTEFRYQVRVIAFAPDGQRVTTVSKASGSISSAYESPEEHARTVVKVWDLRARRRASVFTRFSDTDLPFGVSPDGRYLAARWGESNIKIFELFDSK